MGKGLKIGLLVAGAILLSGFIYWQFVKKGVINRAIANAVSSGTDNMYYVKYESSKIDEIGGNASFKNLVLQSDSLQQLLYSDDTLSIAKEIFNIKIGELNISGANIPSLLRKNKVSAQKVELIRPVITITRTGKKGNTAMSREDSLALYDRITGKFNSIQANEVIVTDGMIAFANGKQPPHTIIQGINIHLKNLRIDSTRNYNNLLSYFVKDIDASIKQVHIRSEKNGNQFLMEGLQYNAPARFIKVDNIVQKDANTGAVLINLRDSRVDGISTNDFIVHRIIQADTISSGGGIASIYRTKKAGSLAEVLEVDNDFFDEVRVKNIKLGSTVLHIYNRGDIKSAPIRVNNARVAIHDIIQQVTASSNLQRLISSNNWNFSGDGMDFNTEDNHYNIKVGPFDMNNAKTTLRLNKISVKPLQSRAAFMSRQKFQRDQYDLEFNNIVLNGINAQALINEQKIFAGEASLQTIIKIYNDRTLPYDTSSKVGRYPHQMLYDLSVPIKVKTVRLRDSYIGYTERGRISTQSGEVFFNNVNASISNLTNIKQELSRNNTLLMNATASFMGLARLASAWRLPVSSGNGTFKVSGEIGGFEATKLNSITRPLGMATIEDGSVQKLTFNISGDDYRSNGDMLLLYDDLKIKLLKNTGEGKPDIKAKNFTSFFANMFMKDRNPQNGQTRKVTMTFDRDTKKSFFNLLWKTLFEGTKKVTKGKNDAS